MVTRKTLEKYMNDAETIAEEIHERPEVVVKVLKQVEVRIENGRRQPRPPAPEGGICIRGAERKYNIPKGTISGWLKRNYIPILLRTKNEVFLDEALIRQVAKIHHASSGKGKKAVSVFFNSREK